MECKEDIQEIYTVISQMSDIFTKDKKEELSIQINKTVLLIARCAPKNLQKSYVDDLSDFNNHLQTLNESEFEKFKGEVLTFLSKLSAS